MHPQTTLLVSRASMDSSMRWVAVVVPLRCVALRCVALFRWLRCVGGCVALVNFVGCVALVVPLRWLPSGMLRVPSIALAQPQTTGQPADLNDHAGGSVADLSCAERLPFVHFWSATPLIAVFKFDQRRPLARRCNGLRCAYHARCAVHAQVCTEALPPLAQPAAAVLPDSRRARWLRPLAPLLVGRHGSVRFH